MLISFAFPFILLTRVEIVEINQFVLAAEDFRGPVVGVYFMGKSKEEFLAGPGARWLGCFNKQLEGKEYFCYDRFTVADLCVFDVVACCVEKEALSLTLEEFPNLPVTSWRTITESSPGPTSLHTKPRRPSSCRELLYQAKCLCCAVLCCVL